MEEIFFFPFWRKGQLMKLTWNFKKPKNKRDALISIRFQNVTTNGLGKLAENHLYTQWLKSKYYDRKMKYLNVNWKRWWHMSSRLTIIPLNMLSFSILIKFSSVSEWRRDQATTTKNEAMNQFWQLSCLFFVPGNETSQILHSKMLFSIATELNWKWYGWLIWIGVMTFLLWFAFDRHEAWNLLWIGSFCW